MLARGHDCCALLLDQCELIDHTASSRQRSAVIACDYQGDQLRPAMAWDGRKGRWLPLVYRFDFPRHAFDQACWSGRGGTCLAARKLGHFEFAPSKRHSVMLDEGTPLMARRTPPNVNRRHHPLGGRIAPAGGYHHHPSPLARKTPLAAPIMLPSEEESMTGCIATSADQLANPFNANGVRPMAWLDDLDIEGFLSSAIDQAILTAETCDGRRKERRDGNGACGMIGKSLTLGTSPCTPSSPPPPLFSDGAVTLPDLQTS